MSWTAGGRSPHFAYVLFPAWNDSLSHPPTHSRVLKPWSENKMDKQPATELTRSNFSASVLQNDTGEAEFFNYSSTSSRLGFHDDDLRNYSFTATSRAGMFFQNQCDYGDANSLRLQQKEWICKGNISLISRTAEEQTPWQKVNRKFTIL